MSASELARTQARRGQPILPPVAWRNEVLPKLLEDFGAHGYQFGRKHSRGRWGRQPAITFFTRQKRDPESADHIKPVPKWIEWKDGKRRHRLRTDVIEVAAPLVLQSAVFGPGDGVAFGSQVASIGAAVIRPGVGGLLTTAGHIFGDGNTGQSVTLSSGNETGRAEVLASVVEGSIDYALLRPLDALQCDNLFRDQIRIGPIYHPTPVDVEMDVMILDRFGSALRTTCRGVNASIESRGVIYDGLITTDAVTKGGQSGGALIDDANRLWGFLIGRFGDFSIFVPAYTLFVHAGVLLIS